MSKKCLTKKKFCAQITRDRKSVDACDPLPVLCNDHEIILFFSFENPLEIGKHCQRVAQNPFHSPTIRFSLKSCRIKQICISDTAVHSHGMLQTGKCDEKCESDLFFFLRIFKIIFSFNFLSKKSFLNAFYLRFAFLVVRITN